MNKEIQDRVIKAGTDWWLRMGEKKLSDAMKFTMMGSFVAGAQAMESSITDEDAGNLIRTFTGVKL